MFCFFEDHINILRKSSPYPGISPSLTEHEKNDSTLLVLISAQVLQIDHNKNIHAEKIDLTT